MRTTLKHLRYEVTGDVATVWLSRPPVNAVHQDMYREIHGLFADIDQMGAGIRAIVLAGDGDQFCAGNDLAEFETLSPENTRERMFHVREAFWAVREAAVPVVAAVHGAALGTGLVLAASCDLIIASDDARFGLPELNVGVMGGARHLGRLLPQALTRLMFFTADPLPASEFLRLGGVVDVVPRDELPGRARAVAERIARHSPTALRIAKSGLNAIESLDLKRGYEFEQGLTGRMSGHPDAKEALRAFREHRSPEYAPPPVADRPWS
ncbi:enoyl-CoA hydratase-related protein [Actinomadura sp. B10D3]|uniref:enoyl-CoA hydratase-related protein n=1 Tax=Actinomadura sp. B10D3 TaxID=3153557 RepID=UPI00325E06B2